MSVRDDILELHEQRQEQDDHRERIPVKSEFLDGRHYPPPGFQPIPHVYPELSIDSPVWASSIALWTDEDLRARYEQALIAVESLFTRVNGAGTVAEVELSAEEQARLTAMFHWFMTLFEIQQRIGEGAMRDLQKKVADLQKSLKKSYDDLREVPETFVPGSTELEN